MGGSSKQTIGYKYRAGLMVAIGNRIEKLLNISPDNRGWILTSEQKKALEAGEASIEINQPNLFGGSNGEGGWIGNLDVKIGRDNQTQNRYLANNIDPSISSYPNLSYLVFRGENQTTYDGMGNITGTFENLNRGFELVSMSGMLKDFMLWVKRIHVKNNGDTQWYDSKSEIGGYRYAIDKADPVNSDGHLNGISVGTNQERKSWSVNGYWENTSWGDRLGVIGVNGLQSYPENSDIQYNTVYNKGWARTTFHHGGGFEGLIKVGGVINVSKDWAVKFGTPKITALTQSDPPVVDPELTKGMMFYKQWVDESSETGLNYLYEFYFDALSFPFAGFGMVWDNDDFNGKNYQTNFRIHTGIPVTPPVFSDNDAPDINPIHKIREIITDYTAMNKSESLINDSNFIVMANRVWDEGLGISWCIQEKSCKEALDELCYHIEGGLRINRQSGLYEVVLFRDDMLNLDNALKFNESNIKTIEFDVANMDEAVSSINVSYYDRDLIKNSSFLLYENGLERTRGFVISENVDFPYFMNRANAEKVGNWKLKQLSSPTWKGIFKTGIQEARRINKYDVIKLSWLNKNLIDLPVRVMNINLGDGINNTVTIDFIEVIPYSNIEYPKTEVDDPIDTKLPPQPNLNTAFEMPYYEAIQNFTQTQVDLELSNTPEIGYLMASSQKPQNNSLNAVLYTDGATNDSAQFQQTGVVNYCPAVYLDQAISYTENVFKIKNTESSVSKFSGATSGTWILLNDEIMVYESFNELTNEITVKRGALDTVPHKHTSGTIFFSDEFSGLDSTQYIQGEDVKYQVLTTTPSAIENIDFNSAKNVSFNARAIRPYPPANVKMNSEYYPVEIETDLVITWDDRNRLQQTSGNIIGWFDGSIAIEQNTSTKIIVLEEDESHNVLATHNNDVTGTTTYTLPISSLDANTRYLNITAKTIRDGFDSYQSFNHIVELSLFFSAPYDLTVEFKND